MTTPNTQEASWDEKARAIVWEYARSTEEAGEMWKLEKKDLTTH